MRMIAGNMVLSGKPMVVVSQNYDTVFLAGFADSGRESMRKTRDIKVFPGYTVRYRCMRQDRSRLITA